VEGLRFSRWGDSLGAAFEAQLPEIRLEVGRARGGASRWMGYVLIGTEASYFTGKARAYLRWKGVSFSETAATPDVYRDVIEPRIGFLSFPFC